MTINHLTEYLKYQLGLTLPEVPSPDLTMEDVQKIEALDTPTKEALYRLAYAIYYK